MRTKLWWIIIAVVIVLVAAGLTYHVLQGGYSKTSPPISGSSNNTNAPVPDFDHVVVIVMENKGYSTIIGKTTQAPYLNQLANQNALASNYYANFHPSLPNYIALTSGTNAGITTDCNSPGGSCLARVKNIANEIEQSGHSWKTYQESMPAPCTAHNSGEYVTKHDPFVYYPDILHDATRCQNHVVPYSQLVKDLANHTLPDYVFITPNLCHDMHDCSVKVGDAWLHQEVPKILTSHAFKEQNSLLVITFDEAEAHGKQNKVPTILIGKLVKKRYVGTGKYSHYSLLHTIEKAWGLNGLTDNDTGAPVMSEFFK